MMTARQNHARVITRHPQFGYTGLDRTSLTRLSVGAYARTAEWDALFVEGRLRTRAHAVAHRITNPRAAFWGASAAALHDLPVYRVAADRVDMVVPGRHTRRNSTDVVRHQAPLPETDVVIIGGVRVTSLDRTVYDVIRTRSLECAVVVFDAALRAQAWMGNTYEVEVAEAFRARVERRIRDNPGARGIRQARFVTSFADGRADRPGESISRLWMWQLGAPDPELQYRVEFGDGTYALLDFAWPALGRWGEFDGTSKYSDATMLAGRTAEQVLESQRAREGRVRQATGWHPDRWGFAQMPTIDAFAEHLRKIGLIL